MKTNVYVITLFTISIIVLLLLTIYYTNIRQQIYEDFISVSEVAENVIPRVATHISKKASDWVNEKKDGFEGSVGKLKEDWRYLNDAENFDDLEKRWETTKAEYVDSLSRMGLINGNKEHFTSTLTPEQSSDRAIIERIIRELSSYENPSNDIGVARDQAVAVNAATTPADTNRYNISPIRMRYDPVTKKYIIDTQCSENICDDKPVTIQYSPSENAHLIETNCVKDMNQCKGKPIVITDRSGIVGNKITLSNSLMDLKEQYKSQYDKINDYRIQWSNIKNKKGGDGYVSIAAVVSPKVEREDYGTTDKDEIEKIRNADIAKYIQSIETRLDNLINQWGVDEPLIDSAISHLKPDASGLQIIIRKPEVKMETAMKQEATSQTISAGKSLSRGRIIPRKTPSVTPVTPSTQPVTSSAITPSSTARGRVSRGRGSRQLFTDYIQKIEGFFGFNQRNMEEYTTIDRVKKDESSAYLLLDLGEFIPPYQRVNNQIPLLIKTWSK